MAKQKKYKTRKKRPFSFRIATCFLRIFIRKPKVINLSGENLAEKAIYIMNHSGARGPLIFELHFPIRANAWGAHEMCGNYKQRWNYLYHVFYQQKLHWGKCKAFMIATIFAVISKWCYTSIGLIGTYTDMRLINTMRCSTEVLNENMSIVIFPEDSSEGYFDKAPSFHKGFIALSKMYYKRTGEDLPVYSVYYARKKKLFVVDKPLYVNALLQEQTEDELSQTFLRIQHRLFDEYVAENKNIKSEKK